MIAERLKELEEQAKQVMQHRAELLQALQQANEQIHHLSGAIAFARECLAKETNEAAPAKAI